MPRGVYPRKKRKLKTVPVKDHLRSPPARGKDDDSWIDPKKLTGKNLVKGMDLLADGLDKIADAVKDIQSRVKFLELEYKKDAPPVVVPQSGYINVYGNGGQCFPTKNEADMYANDGRIACVKWTEGQSDE